MGLKFKVGDILEYKGSAHFLAKILDIKEQEYHLIYLYIDTKHVSYLSRYPTEQAHRIFIKFKGNIETVDFLYSSK